MRHMSSRFLWLFALMAMVCVVSGCAHVDTVQHTGAGIVGRPFVAANGDEVVRRLNALYDDTRPNCDHDTPAYYCSGVIVRAIRWSSSAYFWNNTISPDYQGVSFSYLRRDLGARAVYRSSGYIFSPAENWGKNGIVPLSMFCSFAFDGFTGAERGLQGCGSYPDFPVASRPCAEQGINTVSQFARHYVDVPSGAVFDRWKHQCAFATDWRSFLLSILARQGGGLEELRDQRYSEQVLSTWRRDIPEQLPLIALFVRVPEAEVVPAPGALSNARAMQSEFRDATGVVLPIVRLHVSESASPPSNRAFTFDASDQGPTTDPNFIRKRGVIPSGGMPVTLHGQDNP
jgi:hypothetical protein